MTLVNILSKRARMRIPSARLAPECRVWSSLTLLSGFEVFDIFPSPFVVFDLKWPMEVGPTFYRDDLWWKFRLRLWVRNVDFGRVAYLFYFYQVPNGFRAPVGDFKESRQSWIWCSPYKNPTFSFVSYFGILISWAIQLQIGRFKRLSCEIFRGQRIGELGIWFGDPIWGKFWVLTAVIAHFRAQVLGNFRRWFLGHFRSESSDSRAYIVWFFVRIVVVWLVLAVGASFLVKSCK